MGDKLVIPFTLLVLFSAVDFWCTSLLVGLYGFVVEVNPILRVLMQQTNSTVPILLVKLLTVITYGAVLYNISTVNVRLKPLMFVVTYVLAIAQFYITSMGIRMVIGY